MLVGLLIGYREIRVLVNAMPAAIARYIVNWQNVSLDWRALVFTTVRGSRNSIRIRGSLMGMSYLAVMMTVLGAMALVLACVGVYSVMAYSVTERTREIGVRLALGAETGSVVGMMLRRGVSLTAMGLAIGLACSIALARLLASLIWGVGALDLQTFAGVSAALVGMALLASYVPARRAARVDPLISLRCE